MFVVPASALALSDEVNVRAPGITTTGALISLGELGAPSDHEYTIGGTRQTFSGYTLQQVLDEAASLKPSLSLAAVTGVEVDRPRVGDGVKIAKDDFSVGPPLFFEKDGIMNFVDPSGPRILKFTLAAPGITLVAATESVEIVPLPDTAMAGEKVNFAATVDGLADNEKYDEIWTFGDGTGQTSNTTHTFSTKGSFTVKVAIVGDEGFRGNAKLSFVVGGKKPKDKKPEEDQDPPADDTTDYTPDYGGYPSYPGGTGTGTGGLPGSAGSSPGPPTPTPATPKPEEKFEPPVDDGLTTVTGELVSSSAPAATIAPGDAAAQPPATVTPTSDGFGISSEAWVVIGLLALLGLGMIVEKRGSRLT